MRINTRLPGVLLYLCVSTMGFSAEFGEKPYVTTTGIVEPNRVVVIGSAAMGRIESLNFEEGASVKQGDVLATINADKLKAELASARASRELAGVEADYKEKLENRMRVLRQSKSIGEDKLDEAVFDRAAAQAKVQIADAQIAKIQADLDETEIRAPFDGIVTKKHVEIGQITRPGEPLLVLEDHSELLLQTHVKERDLAMVSPGTPARVTFNALDSTRVEGSVGKIIPSGDPKTHSFEVEIILPEHEGLLPGMFGKVEFHQTASASN